MSEMKQHATRAAWAVFVLLAWTTAAAQQQLEVQTIAETEETVRTASGATETRRVPAGRVIPGDKVHYTVSFTNVGTESADDVVVTNPIDPSLTYVTGSASGADMTIEFSVDGGTSFDGADSLVVRGEQGNRPAQPEDYTHIRWTLDGELDADTTGVARFAATVN